MDIPISIQLLLLAATIYLAFHIYTTLAAERPLPGFPVVSIPGKTPKQSWIRHGNEVLKKGFSLYPGQAFQIITGTGPKIVLPNSCAEEIRNDNRFSFAQAFQKDFFSHYPGFEGVSTGNKPNTDGIVQDTVRMKLTQSLGLVTDDLVEEARDATSDVLGESREWRTTIIKEDLLEMVARLSSRVFLGKQLCRNRQWLDITKSYAVNCMLAARDLRALPALLRPILHWFTPTCVKIRQNIKDTHGLIEEDFERRKVSAQKALAEGRKPPKTADAIGWMVEMAKGREVDVVSAQLGLSLAAIFTTTEAMSQALLDLCEHPEVLPDLRSEIATVLKAHGWAKTAFYKMALLDSFLKESQRFHRPLVSMNRKALETIELSNGIIVPKNSRILVEATYFDPKIYPDPYKFDAYRFMRKREDQGSSNNWQFVSMSKDFLAFGLGSHACPGRFFVANEIKIALSHLLLKYDWRLPPGGRKPSREFEAAPTVDPTATLQHRRRQEEMELSVVQEE